MIKRDLSTPESREFWESAERTAEEIKDWPAWKRAGINVAQQRSEPRTFGAASGGDSIVPTLSRPADGSKEPASDYPFVSLEACPELGAAPSTGSDEKARGKL